MPAARRDLEEWQFFIRSEAHILRIAPRSVFQRAANQPDDTAPARTAEALNRSGLWRRPWLRWLNKPQALGPCLLTLRGHGGSVRFCTYSPDGARFASFSSDGTARLWDPLSGRELASLGGFERATGRCTFSPDGRLLVVTDSHGLVRCCDAWSGVPAGDPSPHYGAIRLCRFTSDGRRLITVGARTVKVRDPWGDVASTISSDGREISVACGDAVDGNYLALAARGTNPEPGLEPTDLVGYIAGCDMTGDGRFVALVFTSGSLVVVDLGDLSRTFAASGHYTACGFAPDGSLVVALRDDGTLTAWTREGTPRWTLGGILSWTFSPDASRLVTAEERPAWGNRFLRDAQTGEIVLACEDSADTQGGICAFSSDGTRVVAVHFSRRTASLWHVEDGKRIACLEGHLASITACAFSPDGLLVVSASEDGTLMVFDSADGRRRARLTGHTNTIRAFAFSPDGSRIVSASDDDDLRVWAARVEDDQAYEFRAIASLCRFSPDGALVVSADWDGRVKLWDAKSGALIAQLYDPDEDLVRIDDLSFSPDGGYLAWAGATGMAERGHVPRLRLWDIASRREVPVPNQPDASQGVCLFSPDGSWLVAGGVDGLRVFDARTGLQLSHACTGRVVDGVPHDWVTACDMSPDGCRLLAGFRTGAIGIWNITRDGVLVFDRFLDWQPSDRDAEFSQILACAWLADADRVLFSDLLCAATVRLSTGETTRYMQRAPVGAMVDEVAGYVVFPDGRCQSFLYSDRLYRHARRPSARHLDVVSPVIRTRVENLRWISPDGRRGLVVQGSRLAVWDMVRRVELCELHTRFELGIARWSPDGRRIVARDFPGTLQLLELEIPSGAPEDGGGKVDRYRE